METIGGEVLEQKDITLQRHRTSLQHPSYNTLATAWQPNFKAYIGIVEASFL